MIAFAAGNGASQPRTTKRARAADPGTPLAVLGELAALYPDEVHANPAFQLMLLVDPASILAVPHAAVHALLKSAAAPESLLAWCANRHEDVTRHVPRARWLIAQHPNATAPVLAMLAGTPEGFLCPMHVASPEAFGMHWTEALSRAVPPWQAQPVRHGDLRVVAGLLRHGLVDGRDPVVRMAVEASGPAACSVFLGVQKGLGADDVAPMFAAAINAVVQTMGARIHQRRSSPPGAARRLERTEFCGPLASDEDAVALASSRKAANRMRACMALGSRLPQGLIASLAVDRVWKVRAAVAYRPQLDLETSLALADDPEPRVREALAGATSHPEVLRRLAEDPHLLVRYRVAGNAADPPEVDRALRSHDSVRECLLGAWQRGEGVNAEGKPLARPDQSDRWTAEECATLALRSAPDALARLLLLTSDRCPAEVLESHATHGSWWLRIAVVRNRRAPAPLIKQVLASDTNWLVRAAATEALAVREEAGARPLPEPLRAAAISERHLPKELASRASWVRAMLAADDWHRVQTGIHASLSDDLLRGLLLAGMIRGRTRMRGSAMTLLRRNVQPQWVRLAEDFLAEQLVGGGTPDREVAAVMAACGGGVED